MLKILGYGNGHNEVFNKEENYVLMNSK
jgi:hypothetical protein